MIERPDYIETAAARARKAEYGMANVRGGFTVLPHVQAFADDGSDKSGITSFGTYPGHDPTPERALDCFVSVSDPAPGFRLCDFAIANMSHYGIDYVIFRQRIYNPEVAPHWRDMPDRGSLTQNHFDHVHISFEATGLAQPTGIRVVSDDRLCQRGERGEAVAAIQRKLMERGYDLGRGGADGDFGDATDAAVRAFQRDQGLTVDGVVGPETLARLNAPVEPPSPPYPGGWYDKGDKGGVVAQIQQRLIERGYDLAPWGADGDFGDATEAAVRQFQRDHGIGADGIVGPTTWERLW